MSNNKEYEKYITINGITSFRLNGKRVARRNVPVEVLDVIDKPVQEMDKSNIEYIDHMLRTPSVDKNILEGRYPGYTYYKYDVYDTVGNKTGRKRRMFYYDGVRIPKKDIPKGAFEYMRRVRLDYEKYWKEYMRDKGGDNTTETMPSPNDLLESLGIYSRKDWKRWLLSNHPDKNPNVDVNLVAMVNNAIDMRYKE